MLVQKTQNVCLGAKASFLLCPLTFVEFQNVSTVIFVYITAIPVNPFKTFRNHLSLRITKLRFSDRYFFSFWFIFYIKIARPALDGDQW